MLPTTLTQNSCTLSSRDAARHTAGAKRYKYLRRLLHFHQMDFEFALWQMFYLFTSPQRVYRNFHYRKQTKDQWARDDPAFLVLLSIWLCGKNVTKAMSSCAFFCLFQSFLYSFNSRLWFGAWHGTPGDSEAAFVGNLCWLHRSWSAYINCYVVSILWDFYVGK